MNKEKIELYNSALGFMLDRYELTEHEMFNCNREECIEARQSLIVGLNYLGLTDKEIAELTHKMRRCSVCKVRNHYDDRTAPWTVKRCIESIKGLKIQ